MPTTGGDYFAPVVAVGVPTSGFGVRRPHSISLLNKYAGTVDAENHKEVRFWDNKTISFGPISEKVLASFSGRAALEIYFENLATGAAVPWTNWEWNDETADVSPGIRFWRSRGTGPGNFATVQAGDELSRIEGWGYLADGTWGVACALVSRVPADWVNPGTGTANLRLAGEVVWMTSVGDGSSALAATLLHDKNGNLNLLRGSLYVGAVTRVLGPDGKYTGLNFTNRRETIADDAVYALAIPGGETAFVWMLGDNVDHGVTASSGGVTTVVPAGRIFVNSADAVAVPDLTGVLGAAGMTATAGVVPTGTTGADDKINVFNNGDGFLRFENRSGGPITLSLRIVA